jgi:RNA polymerase sigma factor (sigma-70 family)
MAAVEPQVDPSAAAEVLYERHSERLLGYFVHQLGSRDEAEDALQTTFLNAFRGLRRGVVPVAEWPWLLTIARNVCLTRWETVRRRRLHEVPRDPHLIEESAPAVLPSAEIPLVPALAALPEQQRRAIVLREWHGLSYREIADELDVSVGAVESLIFRARGSLAKQLRGRRALDLGSLLAGAKSLFGGASLAVKLAVIAGMAGATVAAGAATVTRSQERAAKAPPGSNTRPPESPVAPVGRDAQAATTAVSAAPQGWAVPRPGETVATPGVVDPGTESPVSAAPSSVLLPALLRAPADPPTTAAPEAPSAESAPVVLAPLPPAPSTPEAPALPSATLPEAPTVSTDPVTELSEPVVQEVTGVVDPVVEEVSGVVDPVVEEVAGVVDPLVGEVEAVVEDVVAELPVEAPTVPAPAPAPAPALPKLP